MPGCAENAPLVLTEPSHHKAIDSTGRAISFSIASLLLFLVGLLLLLIGIAGLSFVSPLCLIVWPIGMVCAAVSVVFSIYAVGKHLLSERSFRGGRRVWATVCLSCAVWIPWVGMGLNFMKGILAHAKIDIEMFGKQASIALYMDEYDYHAKHHRYATLEELDAEKSLEDKRWSSPHGDFVISVQASENHFEATVKSRWEPGRWNHIDRWFFIDESGILRYTDDGTMPTVSSEKLASFQIPASNVESLSSKNQP